MGYRRFQIGCEYISLIIQYFSKKSSQYLGGSFKSPNQVTENFGIGRRLLESSYNFEKSNGHET